MSQPSDNKAEEKKDASDVSVGSAIAVSVADALTEAAGGERRSRDSSVSKVVGVTCTSHRRVDAVVATVDCTTGWTLFV